MNIFAQPKVFYRRMPIDGTDCPIAAYRHTTLERIMELTDTGCTVVNAARSQGISKSTYYRWRDALKTGGIKALRRRSTRPLSSQGRHWDMIHARCVLDIRRDKPYAGKMRIFIEYNQLYPDRPLALAAVGRILRWGIKTGRIQRCDFQERARPRKARNFSKEYAQRWRKEDFHLGVQIDHMTVSRDSNSLKEFRAVCPVTRLQYCKAYSRATSGIAASFLTEVMENLQVRAIQVDGGSEFMGEFEEACKEMGIPLKVLPPRSPKLNGIVERANRTARIEFWNNYTGKFNCEAVNMALVVYLHYYNNERPHRSLGMKTPSEMSTIMAIAA